MNAVVKNTPNTDYKIAQKTSEQKTRTSKVLTQSCVASRRSPTDNETPSRHALVMTSARSLLVDPNVPGFYHCVSRYVRRAWLCGVDPYNGASYEHRRAWVGSTCSNWPRSLP
jgi:hypothetical protein